MVSRAKPQINLHATTTLPQLTFPDSAGSIF
jgi:hypothetical protein